VSAVSPTPTRMEPAVTDGAEAFWDATRRRQLVLPWCSSCQQPFWYPRPACPRCLGSDIEWRPASGRGEVYAVTVVHRAQNPLMADRAPYPVALIDLEEGVRVMSNVVGVEAAEVQVGLSVQATWEELTDGRNLLLFEPVASP
jgi:uncharacterized OB-fold protein